ncbi:MAG: 50S ribosome-binding GTPase [Clostridiales bacterium]|nr:50S ribosome-binding GTPase [Clostridiales bacterium]
MMEQVYGTTEDQIREVKSIARRFLGKTQNYQGFSKSFKTSVEEQVNKKVLGLLQEQKPKVLVYGIYNAGKSTLVNVLCGKEVAEVGDRPTTAKTQPYDAGKYILMDTPGIDAPIKHEMEADENMNNCHVILFVVSSKGGFESRKNYERMVEMIQRGLPFYIILNDRGSATTDEQEHQRELESIQQKIITNLIQVSGDDHIDEKYEVITLNTKRAWTGIQKGKQILVEKSGIRALQLRLENLLRENGALQWLSTPLSTLKELLEKATDELQKQLGNQEYAERRKKLMDEYKHFETAFLADANSILNAKRDAIFQACLAHEESNLRQVIDEGAKQTQDAFEKDQKPLQGLLETISNAPLRLQASMQDYLEGDPLSIGSIGSAGKSTFSKAGVLAGPAAQAAEKAIAAGSAGLGALSSGAAVISGALTKAIPVIGWGITAISILDGIFNAGKRREEREYERAEREAELANQQAQARYQQEKLRRQNANSETTRIMDEIRQQQREFFAQKVQSVVDKKIQEIEAQIRQQEAMDKTIRDFLEELDNWKETLRNIQTALT